MFKRRYEPTTSGVLTLLITVVVGVGAVLSENNLVFGVLGIALGGIIASGALSGLMMMRCTVARAAPDFGVAGQPVRVRYTVRNRSTLVDAYAIKIDETVRTARGERARIRAAIAHVPRRSEVSVSTTLTLERRGEARFTGVRISSTFPFGLARKSIEVPAHASMSVHPHAITLQRDAALAVSERGRDSEHEGAVNGPEGEFFGLRDYVDGDSPRSIAWKPSARTGRMVVRELARAEAGRLRVVLRLANAPDEREADRAATLAAAFVRAAGARGRVVGLELPDSGRRLPPVASSAGRHRAMLDALAIAERTDGPVRTMPPDHDTHADEVVVHAGAIDPSSGSARARHVSSHDLERLVAGQLPGGLA
ncbi:MAG: DUF58 domain-containing protein [Planctomycetota bacterium]